MAGGLRVLGAIGLGGVALAQGDCCIAPENGTGTADFPAGARFIWNVEVLWAADLFLQRLSPKQQADFFDAVKRGQVALNGIRAETETALGEVLGANAARAYVDKGSWIKNLNK